MVSVKRLNLDSSWHISFDSNKFIIDPWLLGSEIDGFNATNCVFAFKYSPVTLADILFILWGIVK